MYSAFYATPRDQVTWLKLMHRNLYLAPHKDDPNDTTCPVCGAHQNQLHLTTCFRIRQDFWDPIIKIMRDMGFPGFTHGSFPRSRTAVTHTLSRQKSVRYPFHSMEVPVRRTRERPSRKCATRSQGSLQTHNYDEHLQVEVLRREMAQMGAKEHTHRQQIQHS